MPTLRCSLLLAAGSLLPFVLPAAAQAQQAPQAAPTAQGDPEPGGDDLHAPIVVTAAGLDTLDLLAGTSVLQGVELQRNLGGQIGEVLARLPGVSATSFSPGASRPVLRGFGGDRVRVLIDGVGTIDAASTSDDHAVAIDPLIADRIEVLRGPAVLLYGSQAIGGAVNVVTRRIPPRLPDEPIHIDGFAALDSAYDRREAGLSLDLPIGTAAAFHVDGSFRETDDVDIPGYVVSDGLRAQLLADAAGHFEEGEPEEGDALREAASIRGTLPNSATETKSLGTGLSLFSGDSSLGAAFSYYDTRYGIPERPGVGHFEHLEEGEDGHDDEAEEGHGEVPVTIGLRQYRGDLKGVLDLGDGALDELRARLGYSDYTHTEFEGDEVGTRFLVEGVEARLELVQSRRTAAWGSWGGSVGAQFSHQDFAAIGAEAFVPANLTDQVALFTVQEIALDPVEIELGGRYERTEVEAATLGEERSFDTVSGALGLSTALADALRVGLNASRAERAPSAQELFAEGPHVATQQFEIGNGALGKESAWGMEAYLRGRIGPATISLAAYRNWFSDFIYLQETGEEQDELPVFQFLQQDADQWGVEGEISAPLVSRDGFTLLGELRGDYVRATLDDGSPVPRIPPLSLFAALEAQTGHFDPRVEVQWFAEQDRIAAFETPTDSFALVNLSLAWHPLEGDDNVTVLLQADNVFDAEARRHASFTKDFVPLAGRNVKLSARLSL